jgi:quercetin dioxygenase-like cupin family protein
MFATPSFSLSSADEGKQKPKPKIVVLDNSGKDYLQVLAGPPDSVTIRSGLVVLPHGKSVEKHSTGKHEELLVILSGKGEMTLGVAQPFRTSSDESCRVALGHQGSGEGSLRVR